MGGHPCVNLPLLSARPAFANFSKFSYCVSTLRVLRLYALRPRLYAARRESVDFSKLLCASPFLVRAELAMYLHTAPA